MKWFLFLITLLMFVSEAEAAEKKSAKYLINNNEVTKQEFETLKSHLKISPNDCVLSENVNDEGEPSGYEKGCAATAKENNKAYMYNENYVGSKTTGEYTYFITEGIE